MLFNTIVDMAIAHFYNVNRILVLDNGTRVINIGLEKGEFEIYSWKLPDKIANQNRSVLKESILKEVKDSLKDNNWIINGKDRNKSNSKLQKLSESSNIQRYSSINAPIKEINPPVYSEDAVG